LRYVVIAIFMSLVTLVVVLGHRYIWQRLVKDTNLHGWPYTISTGLIISLGILIPLTMSLGRRIPRDTVNGLFLAGYSWLGIFAFLVVMLIAIDILRRIPPILRRRNTAPSIGKDANTDVEFTREDELEALEDTYARPQTGRRQFLARSAGAFATTAAAGVFVIGSKNALGEVDIHELDVRLPRLPKQLDGLKIVQITDVHIGPLLDGRFLDAIVEKINAESPDIVVITGDLVDGSVKVIGPDVAKLGKLQSRYGQYFCTGNHEYYSGAEDWTSFLSGLNVKTLLNEYVSIGDTTPGGASFDLAGIPDRQGKYFNNTHSQQFQKMLAQRDPDRELVLLSHRPNPIREAADHGVGLQLSGHTHGGQFFPITVIGDVIHPYNRGLHQHNDLTQIYVSCGTGFWGPPIRIMAPAEITAITLTS
jgi:hypothetical protein